MTLLCGQITLKVLNDIRSLAFYTQIINTHSQSTELADFHLYYATEACKCKWSNDGAMMIVLRQVDKDTAAANDPQWIVIFANWSRNSAIADQLQDTDLKAELLQQSYWKFNY